jgi:hypothetical protein
MVLGREHISLLAAFGDKVKTLRCLPSVLFLFSRRPEHDFSDPGSRPQDYNCDIDYLYSNILYVKYLSVIRCKILGRPK